MTHKGSEPAQLWEHVASGVASVRIRRVLIADGEPSSVTFAPIELKPFEVRCEFRLVEDEAGVQRDWLVGGPALVEPRELGEPAEISPAHRRTLEENSTRYKNIALALIDVRFGMAAEVREAMLAATRRSRESRRPWSRLERLDLALEYASRRGEYGLIDALGDSRGVTRFEITRQLKKANEDGQVPGGYPPQQRQQ